MFRKLALVVAVFAMAMPAPPAMSAAIETVIASGPGSFASTYTQPVAVASVSGRLTYVNVDIQGHDVISTVAGPGDQPWCDGFGLGQCPIFWSELIFLGKSTPVLGLSNLQVGETYPFYCSLHGNMTGTLVAVP
jgi:plastocyanin